MDSYDEDGIDDAMNQDFGPMEMFDSSQVPVGTMASGAGDDARERDDAPKKHKKKKSKKHRNAEPETSNFLEEDASVPAANEYDVPDDDDATAEQMGSSQQKRKKNRHSSEGSRRKKRRTSTTEQEAPAQSVQDGDEASAVMNLQAATVEDQQPEATMAVEDAADTARMAVEQPPKEQTDMDKLAMDALNRHMNGQGERDEEATSYEAPTAVMEESVVPATDPGAPFPNAVMTSPKSSPKQTRAKGKKSKAKPTFFEKPTEPATANENEDGDGKEGIWEVPSPEATSPKQRKRAKPQTQKKSRDRKKLSNAAAEDADEERPAAVAKRSKSAGFVQGRFTDEENAAIKRAVERFRDHHGFTQEEVNTMIQAPGGTNAGNLHAEMWDSIFAEVPHRYRQKVINSCRKNYHNFVARGTWTPEQDEELRDLIAKHSRPGYPNWAKIAGLVNRHPEDIRDRYRNYIVCGDSQRKDAWSEEEESRLAHFVIEAMTAIDELRRSGADRELFQKTDEELVDWQSISERMDRTRSRLQCITKWRSMNLRTHAKDTLASRAPDADLPFRLEKSRRQLVDMPESERARLIMAIQQTEVGSDDKIPWQKLVDKTWRTKYHRPVQQLLWHRLKRTIPGYQEKTTRDLARRLLEAYHSQGGFPDIDDHDQYSIPEEIDIITPAPTAAPRARAKSSKNQAHVSGHLSNAMIDPADDGEEGDTQAEADATAEVSVADMQIDPALIAAAAVQPFEQEMQASEMAAFEAPGEATTTKTAKQTYSPSNERPVAEESAPTQDTIQDMSQELPELPMQMQDDDEIEDPSLRAKKTPGRFKSPLAHKATLLDGEHSAEARAEDRSGSEMDDMEDIPAA